LYETTLVPRADLPAFTEGQLVFIAYGMNEGFDQLSRDVRGKIAVYFNNLPASLPATLREGFAARRAKSLADPGAVALVSIDNPAAIEPTHWPASYARAVTIKGAARTAAPGPLT